MTVSMDLLKLNLIEERSAGHMELGCYACCDMLGMMLQGDLTAEHLTRFHQCLCQGPASMHQVQLALSQVCSKLSGECNPKTLLDTMREREKRQDQAEQLLWDFQILNGLSRGGMSLLDSGHLLHDLTENRISSETWWHFLSQQMTHHLDGPWKEGKDSEVYEGESLKTRPMYLMEMERERHRVSSRWSVGSVSAVIHDDRQELEPMDTEGKDGVSNAHLLRLVEQKYKILTERLHQEMLQEHWGEQVWDSLCDEEREWKMRELEALADQAVIHHYDTWALSQLPGAFRIYSFSLSSIVDNDADPKRDTLTDGKRSRICSEAPSCFINGKKEVATSLSLLLDLHRHWEQEMSSILSMSMSPAQRTQLLLSQYYLQCQAQYQGTFETSALVLSNTEWEESIQSPWFYENRNETLAVRALQEFICSTLHQKPGQSEVAVSDLSDQAKLGRVHIQMKILEQLCENHKEEQSLLLQFIYKQMMSFPGVESRTELSSFSDTANPGQNGNDWIIPPLITPGDCTAGETGQLQLSVLKEAFVLYWERNEVSEQSMGQSPAIQGLVELQQRQLAEVRELIQQLEGQSLNDLVHTYCSLHEDFRTHRCHNNLAAMLLGLVTPKMDVEQIGEDLGSATGPVWDRMDKVEAKSDTCTINMAEVKGDVICFSETLVPILGDFPMVQDREAMATPQKVKQMNEAQLIEIEQEPVPSDSLKITGIMAGTNSGTSGLLFTVMQCQNHRSQEQNTVRDPIPETQKAEEQGANSIGLPTSQSQHEETCLDIPLDEDSINTMCEEREAKGQRDLVRDEQCPGEETDTKPRELDPIPETQKAEEQGANSIGLPTSQSQHEETCLDIPLDEDSINTMCEECEAKGQRDLMRDEQCLGEETDTKPRELPHITGPQREVNMILISDDEKENVMRSLAHVQRKAEEKRRRDKERQTLRVQECLSIARNRTSTVDHPFLQTYSQDHHLHEESTHWRTRVKETLEQLRQERTFALKSKGERNTASFKELIEPTETKDLTDEQN